MLSAIPDDRVVSILDLGPALRSNVDFWSRYPCKLYIEDFFRCFPASAGSEDGCADVAGLFSFNSDIRFDAILAWDLFNYLNMETLGAMMQKLGQWCRPRSMVFALVSSQPLIPAWPMLFRILDREQVSYQTCTQEVSPCPRHQPRDLARTLPSFDVAHSFLLRTGIQEYIFTYSTQKREGARARTS